MSWVSEEKGTAMDHRSALRDRNGNSQGMSMITLLSWVLLPAVPSTSGLEYSCGPGNEQSLYVLRPKPTRSAWRGDSALGSGAGR